MNTVETAWRALPRERTDSPENEPARVGSRGGSRACETHQNSHGPQWQISPARTKIKPALLTGPSYGS
jgi:hypothetical protein